MPSTPAKYGIKISILADSKTFYISRIRVYWGKQSERPFVVANSGAAMVKRLVSYINGSGGNITIDDWFTVTDLQLIFRRITLVCINFAEFQTKVDSR